MAHGRIRPDEAARQLNSLVASAQPTGDFAATDLTRCHAPRFGVVRNELGGEVSVSQWHVLLNGATSAVHVYTLHDAALIPGALCVRRRERTGFPEVVWGPGKTPLQIATIMRKLAEQDQLAVASRIEPGVTHASHE